MYYVGMFLGLALGIGAYIVWMKYMKKSIEKQNINLNKDDFVIKRTKVGVIFYTLILVLCVIVFVVRERTLWYTLFTIFMVVVSVYKIQFDINRKIIVKDNFVTTEKGEVYNFSEFDFCRTNGKLLYVFKNNRPIIKLNNEDVGFNVFVEKLKNANVEIEIV